MFNVATTSTVKNSLTSVKNILRNGTALSKSVLTMAGMLALSSTAQANDNFTTPQGENVVGGSASFSRAQGQLDVNQHSNRAVINWDHFNIGKDATVQFAQPNSGSMAVNRVVGPQTDPTKILGTLKANGQVAVLDRNGVIFRPGSKVDVAGLIASTGDINVNKFMNEGVFELSNFGNGSVINEGTITIADHGLAAFVAPMVENNGIITAKMGRVQLAGTTQVTTVDLYGDGLLEIAVNEETAQTLVQNTGNIDAEGGVVAMTATAAKGIVDNIINTEGVVSVASATTDGGKIILGGSKDGGNVRVAGTLDASGTNGGSVDVTGYDIETTADASVDVSGSEGNGGSAVFFAENNAVYANKFDATGADAELELGGFVETSAKQTVDFLDGVDVQVGLGGTWLIDPTNIDIDATLASSLVTTMNGGGAGIVDTASPDPDAGNITFLADVIWTGQGSLTLTADNNIILGNYTVQSGYASGNGTRGAVSFVADNNIRSNGGSIITARGNVSLDAGGQVRLVDTTLDSTNGAFVLDAGSTFLLDNSTITTTKDLALISTGLMTIKGGSTVTATNKTVDIDANNGLSLLQNSTIVAKTLDIDAKRVQQDANAQIEVDNLQGTVRGAADFSGTDNQVKTIQNFDTGTNSTLYSGGFTLVDSDEGLDVAGIITAAGGDVSLTTAGTNNKNLTVKSAGAIQTNGGAINLTSTNSKVSVSGELDATGSDSAITLSGTDIILGNGSVIQSEDGVAPFDGALTLTATDGVINQNAGSTIITASLVGSSTKATNLQGAANQVGEILGFTTGVVGVENGGFKLVEADGFVVSGDIVSQGGAIELKTNSSGFVEAIDIASSGGLFSNNGNITLDTNGAIGGAVFVNGQINGGASGNLTFNARQAQLRSGSTIGGNRTTFTGGLVTQNVGSTMTVGRIDGTLNAYAYFDGAANEIGGFGDFATGVAGFSDGGIRVTDILGGFFITGDVSTDGAAIEINTQGGNFTQSGGKTISTNGGALSLTNADGKVTFSGTVDTTGTTDANITITSTEVALNGNSIITAGGADVDVTATNGKITQGNNSQLIANVLTGSATDLVSFNGDANDIVELNGFTSNGNFLFEDGNAGFVVTGDILSNGGKIDLVANTANWNDDIEVVNGVTLNSDGGNVTFENTAGRVIMRHGSVLNAGTGNVTFDLGGALQLQGSNSLTADNLSVTASKATQSSNATLNVDTLEVTTQMDAAFEGGANQINQLRDIKTGEAIWNDGGFTLVDSTGGLVINGDVLSTGEAISITTAGGEISLNGSRSVTSGGGDISLATDGNVDIRGTVDATGSDGNVTISGADIAFNGSALVQTEDGVAPFDGVLTLTSTGSISQSNNAALVTGLLQGSSSGATNLNGINEVTNLGNFAADGGFSFTDTADGLNITGNVATVDSDIAISVTGDLDVTGSVDATGGDVNLSQTGIFSAVVDAIRTAVSGTITLQQNDGGSINEAVQSVENSGNGLNTINVAAGTYNENIDVAEANFLLSGAQNGVDGNDGSRGTGETIVTNGSGSLFQIFADNITVDGFTFTGADRGIEINSTILNTVDNITLVNNRFDNVGSEGVYADTVNSLNVETSYFTGGTDAIEIDGGSTLTVTDNTFVSVGEDGLDVDDVDGVVVTSNNLDGAGDAGFKFAASSDVTVGGSNANRNTIANAARGVVFDGGVTGTQEVSFNTFNTNTVGVDVDGDHDVLIDKNDFDGNTTGVRVTDANDVDVTRNVFNNGTDDVVASGSSDLFVDNNEFNSTNGVKVTGGSDAVVQRNDFFNSNYGVQLFNTTNAVIGNDILGGLRNTFDGVEYAVYASGTTDTLVSRNKIDDSEVAIEFVDGSGGTIQRNTIDGEGSEQLCFGSFCLPIFLPTYGDTAIQVSNQAGVTVDRNTVEGFDNGLYGNNANDLVLSKNTFTGRDLLGISLGTAVEVENSTGVEIGGDPRSDFRNTISNYNNGIVFSNVDNGLIQNNLVQDSLLGTAITLENGSDGNTLDANRIIDVRKAISLSGSDSNVITANDIDDISNNAIELTSGSDSNQVNGNFVDNADRGFRVSGASNGNSFDSNRVRNGGNGAYVTDSTGTSFTGNTFSQLSRDAVYLSNAGTTTLTNNTISFVDYGVYATGSDDLTVTGGTIRDTNEAGVSINGGENATVELVTLRRTDGNGIEVFDNTGTVTLDTNDVRRATANGIYVFNSSGSVLGNTANANEGNGIFVDESSNVDVDNNFANNNDLNGIYVNDSSNIGVDGNQANNNDLNGIYANAVSSSEFNGNTANSNDASHGIFVQDSNNVTLDGNTTNANAVAGIFVDPSENIGVVNNTANGNEIGIWFDEVTNGSIFNNTTDNNTDAGIAVDNSTQISIDANASNVGNDVGIRVTDSDSVFMRDQVISDSVTTGVQVSGDSNNIILSNSTISNSGTYGVFAEGAEIGSITLSGNTLNNNDVQARFESGLLDISDLTNPNTLNGGRIGFQFDPASNDFQDMLLVNDTFGATEFFGQSEFYIELLDGAFFDVANNSPLVLNALDANFDGFIPNNSEFGPGILTLEQFNAIQAKLYDLNDEAGRGLVFAGSVPGLSEEDIFSTALTNFTLPGSGFAVTLAGLPFISADSAAALNALVTAAGDSAEDLANIETAAGGDDYGCWTDVGASLDGTTYYNNSVTFSFSNDVGETLNDQAGCGQ